MNKKVEKQTSYILLIIAMSMIVLGLTIGQIAEPILYTFIPIGLFLWIVAFIRIKKMKNSQTKNEKFEN